MHSAEIQLPQFEIFGKISTFGGPRDTGVQQNEPLALVTKNQWRQLQEGGHNIWTGIFRTFFNSNLGPARSLNEDALYCAMRWSYRKEMVKKEGHLPIVTPTTWLRKTFIYIENESNGRWVYAQPVDWGPHVRTDRLIDVSPGVSKRLGVQTDSYVRVVISPERP